MTNSEYADVIQQLKVELISSYSRISSHGFTLGLDFVGGMPRDILTTFAPDWLEEYQSNGYVVHDPVVIWGSEFFGIKSWNELADIYPGMTPDVIGLARNRGMKNGSVISATVNRKHGILGITHDAPQLTQAECSTALGRMADILFAMQDRSTPKLSDKSVRFLRSIAQGKTIEEIAQRSGVTARATYGLQARTLDKLEANTLPQAILRARDMGFLD